MSKNYTKYEGNKYTELIKNNLCFQGACSLPEEETRPTDRLQYKAGLASCHAGHRQCWVGQRETTN